MQTMQEVQAYLKREIQRMHSQTPESLMAEALGELADTCQSVEEFVEKAQQIPVTGAGIEQVSIAKEYREIALEAISKAFEP